MDKLKKFFKEFNKTKNALLIGQIIIILSLFSIILTVIDFFIKVKKLEGEKLTNYILQMANDSQMLRISGLVFDLNWAPDYLKEIYLYHVLSAIPFLILLIYIFQMLKNIFKALEDKNQPFTIKSINSFRNIGVSVIVWFIVKMGFDIIYPMNIMIKHNEAYAENDLFGSAYIFLDLRTIIIVSIIAVVFIGISHIIKKGFEIKAENDSFI